jgi:hypothetical protein
MAKTSLAKYFRKLSVFCLCALLLTVISLTFGPVYAKMDSDKNKDDKAAAKVIEHMEKMKEKCPEIGGKKKQVEEKLNSGTETPHGACAHCHTGGTGGSGPKVR